MSSLPVLHDRWNYVGLTVNYKLGEAHFFVNQSHEGVTFKPGKRSMQGRSFTIGGPNPPTSALSSIEGAFRSFALYGTNQLSVAEHRKLFETQSVTLARMTPTLRLDPTDASAVSRDFVLPDSAAAVPESIRTAELEGRQVLRITGAASAGVELAANERGAGDAVELKFDFLLEPGDGQTLCTVGDANQHARVIVQGDEILLLSHGQSFSCGKAGRGVWQQLMLSTQGDMTRVTLDSNPPAELRHNPEATWLYLGEGYRPSVLPAEPSAFSIDISTVRSRILHPSQ
jgi:hypothetical protein